MIDIPPDRISEEQLYSLVESFVLREGTDYG
ncbi:MAG: YheU family protein, partial [bacterium]